MKNLSLDSEIARYVVRRRRIKEKNLTLEDLKGLDISKSTASNIENMKSVREDYFHLYLKKIDLKKKELEFLSQIAAEEVRELTFRLDAVEEMIEDGNTNAAQTQLTQLEIEDFHPLAPWCLYLQGVIYRKQKDYKSAEKKYLQAVNAYNKFSLNPRDNIISACYNSLGICSYFQDNLEQAIDYINLGLNVFNETKDMEQIKYKLYGNKILYLMNQSRNDEAFLILNEVWPQRSDIDKNNGALFDFYTFRATLLRYRGMYTDAIQVCEEGFKTAFATETAIWIYSTF